jgi:hypothetical protein
MDWPAITSCILIGAAGVMLDRRHGMRTIRTWKSRFEKEAITKDLGYGFIAGQRPTIRFIVVPFVLAILLWQVFGVLALHDVLFGALAIALGILLEPLAETIWRYVIPWSRAFDKTVDSLEKGDPLVSPTAMSSFERMKKAWYGETAPSKKPAMETTSAAPTSGSTEHGTQAPIPLTPEKTAEEKAMEAYDKYVNR